MYGSDVLGQFEIYRSAPNLIKDIPYQTTGFGQSPAFFFVIRSSRSQFVLAAVNDKPQTNTDPYHGTACEFPDNYDPYRLALLSAYSNKN